MLSIRLSRVGKKKYPLYRIIVQEKSRDPWGKALEILGNYNPHTKEFNAKQERIKHWLSVGAQMSATINNLLIKHNIIQGKKMKATRLKKKEKSDEKKKEPESPKPTEASEEKTQEAKIEEKPAEDKEDKKPARNASHSDAGGEEKPVEKDEKKADEQDKPKK
jgi:small subunit ribosomal protein S16